MTAAYPGPSYVGFALPYLLASAAPTIAPGTGLLLLAALAAVTLVGTAWAAMVTPAPTPA